MISNCETMASSTNPDFGIACCSLAVAVVEHSPELVTAIWPPQFAASIAALFKGPAAPPSAAGWSTKPTVTVAFAPMVATKEIKACCTLPSGHLVLTSHCVVTAAPPTTAWAKCGISR